MNERCQRILARHLLAAVAAIAWASAARAATDPVPADVGLALRQFCADCHADGAKKGGVSLDEWKGAANPAADRARWVRVIDVLERGEMPPKRKRQPDADQRRELIRR